MRILSKAPYDDYYKFVHDLVLFANKWVDEKAEHIMRHALDLYENTAVQILLTEWVAAKKDYDDRRIDALEGLAPDTECVASTLESCKWERKREQHYCAALQILLVEESYDE